MKQKIKFQIKLCVLLKWKHHSENNSEIINFVIQAAWASFTIQTWKTYVKLIKIVLDLSRDLS